MSYDRNGIRLLVGDTRELMRELDAESVQCCVTSPPYFGLRDYGCDGQIGLEPTPAEYVAAMVEVFREVRRVLRPDGTLWLNLGDRYSGARGGEQGKTGQMADRSVAKARCRTKTWLSGGAKTEVIARRARDGAISGLKPKDLIGIPWRVAFALQADGWWLRSDIIWAKPNPMPESVRDRPTRAHEYLFLLTKSERYYYDAEAIREPAANWPPTRVPQYQPHAGRSPHRGLHKNSQRPERRVSNLNANWDAAEARGEAGAWRNKRDVWNIATEPFAGAHFAVMPTALVEPCILAGSRVGDLVLDPFSGSGTTAAVAWRNERRAIGIDLNPAYVEIAARRLDAEMAKGAQRPLIGGVA